MLPVLFILQLINAACLLLDELLFPHYRRLQLKRPVFVLGVPRSGTTHTHHLLAHDARFTTVALWEALFAPSIVQRHLFRALARLDRRCGSLAARALRAIERRLQGALADVHPTGLSAPEEDFLLLLPWLDCFLLALLFPDCAWLWEQARADDRRHPQRTHLLMQRYQRLLQRHVFFHGPQRQLLSKNASFAGIACALAEQFPDSLIVVCERDAPMAARSQLRSLADVRRRFHVDRACPDFQERLLDLLHFYYRNLDRLGESLPARRCVRLPLWHLSRQPRLAMQMLYEQLSLGSPAALDAVLARIESEQPARPATRVPTAGSEAAADRQFHRFQPWRHVPENRL